MPIRYKIWFQPEEGKTIFEDPTQIFFSELSDSQRRGILKGFRLLTINDPLSVKRLQIQNAPIFRITTAGNVLSPGYLSNLLMGPPLINPQLFNENMPPGIFLVENPITPLYNLLPKVFQKFPYTLILLMKIPNTSLTYLVALQDRDELEGILSVLQWLNIPVNDTFITLEDQSGNVLNIDDLVSEGPLA